MKFLELYNLLIHEAQFVNKPKWEYQLKDHTGKTYNLGRKKELQQPQDTSELHELSQVKYRLTDLFRKYGFSTKNLNELSEKLSTDSTPVLFRGHKTINPFQKDTDTKSPGNTVYWAKQPKNALTFSEVTNTGGTKGRSYQTLLHQIYGNYSVGYLSIAYPKYPQAIKWYDDFGVEREKQDAIKHRQQTGKGIDYDNHNGTLEYPSYRMNDKTGYERAETVLGPDEVIKLKTYVILIGSNRSSVDLLNLNTIKQKDPELYKVLLWNRLE